MRGLLYLKLFFLLLLPNLVFAEPFGSIKVGVEFEYEGKGVATDALNTENFRRLLVPFQQAFGGTESEVKPWNKYNINRDTFYAFFIDAEGRKWQAVPEIMNKGFDGYELITPPLTSKEDGERLRFALTALEESGLFVRGKSSSTHYTFDISHLITEKDNVSKIVDLILYIENNIRLIYQTMGPTRYGQIVNYYAVPLSVNQKELLHELSILPEDFRTYENVRSIFLKWHKKEVEITSYEKAWKFRAVNYGKFFGLGQFHESIKPVVEFRLGDLATSQQAVKMAEFLTSIVQKGSQQKGIQFKDPFPKNREFTFHTPVNERVDYAIKDSSKSTYFRWIKSLGLETRKYPQQYRARAFKCSMYLTSPHLL